MKERVGGRRRRGKRRDKCKNREGFEYILAGGVKNKGRGQT